MYYPARYVLLAMAVPCLLCSGARSAENASSQLQQTMEQLKTSKAQEEAISQKVDKAHEALEKIQQDSVSLAEQMHDIEAQQIRKAKSLDALQRQLHDKQARLSIRQKEAGTLIQGMIRMQRLPRQFVVAQPGNADTLLRTASALDITYKALSQSIGELQEQMQELQALREKISLTQEELEKKQAALRSKQASMATLLQSRQDTYRKHHADYEATRQRVARLSEQSQSLQELIGKLDTEEAIFRQMGAPLAKPSSPPAPTESASDNSLSTASLKPSARGTLVHRFGEKLPGGGIRSGHVLRTAAAAIVTAPQAGKVAFTGKFMDYGNVVILQHNNGVHTVLAGFRHMMVEPGQSVRGGEPLGVMGDTPPTRELYLELRKNSKPIDPSSWIGNVGLKQADRR